MANYFGSKKTTSSFEKINEIESARLVSVCKAEGIDSKMPSRVMHAHPDRSEIVFIQSGSGLFTIGEKQYNTSKGDILLYNSGITHDECTNPGENMIAYSCGISGLKIKGLPTNHFIPNNVRPVIPSGEYFTEIEFLFQMMYKHILRDTNSFAESANYLLQVLLVIILSITEKESRLLEQSSKIAAIRIKNYIDNHCLEDISLSSISSALKMNQYYLSHLFKDAFGYSPIQYVIRRRIGEAQSLLINTEYSNIKIAEMVGFNNVNYFYNVFVKMIGMSPGSYRKYWMEEQSCDK